RPHRLHAGKRTVMFIDMHASGPALRRGFFVPCSIGHKPRSAGHREKKNRKAPCKPYLPLPNDRVPIIMIFNIACCGG
ncbi:MAG: hypothetical protein IKS68_07620, partial [Mailhella sp.]|nr:hypothetical protein [Mailhella sp.]